ncbi:MAG: SDR family oxidoreductase [Thalassospira sp.]|uniref:SDR family oxidoreductase n=1 Tax=Thalassospira sp. TaxID=1912094 RepID=UPI003A8C67EC
MSTLSSRLNGKHILVVDPVDPITRQVCTRFRNEGAHVIALTFNKSESTAIEGVDIHEIDLGDEHSLKALADAITPLHAMFINTAQHIEIGTLLACDPDNWTTMFSRIVHTAFHIIRTFLPTLIYSGGGAVTLVSSIAGHTVGIQNRCAFSAANASLVGLSKSIAVDYGAHGIRCNTICPGVIETPNTRKQFDATGDAEGARRAATARQMLGRFGTIDELAHLAVYLASDESNFTTGQTLVMDGGYGSPR